MEYSLDRLSSSLATRYTIEREVGRGGTAIVYRAADIRHKRPVALKVLDPALISRIGAWRFRQEIEITAALQHPHVLPLLDSGSADQTIFFVMPFVEGGSLRDLIRQGPLPVGEALRIGWEVASALSYAHRRGIVHLDIKPENILLSDGHAVVADFGIARALCDGCPVDADPDAWVVGTPAYMSPEQAEGRPTDARSDIYSFACVLHEMLTGRPPFAGITPEQVLAQHWLAPAPHVRTVRPEVPERLADVLWKALAKDPAQRPANIDAVNAELWAPSVASPLLRVGPTRPRQMDLFPLAL